MEQEECPGHSDPFRVRLHFSVGDYVKMAVVGVTLLPLRILGMLSCFIVAWILASVGMIGWKVRVPSQATIIDNHPVKT